MRVRAVADKTDGPAAVGGVSVGQSWPAPAQSQRPFFRLPVPPPPPSTLIPPVSPRGRKTFYSLVTKRYGNNAWNVSVFMVVHA